jgi:uncharacterized repeat protein (TIGR01451 family)
MKTIRIALLAGMLAASAVAGAQIVVDYSLAIGQGGVATPGGEVIYATIVNADWWTEVQEPFVVKLTVPPGLEPPSACFGSDGLIAFDAETRVLSWSARMDNLYLAQRSCPLIFRVEPSLPPGTVLPFQGTLTTSKPDPNPANDTATFTSIVLPASDLEVTGSVDVLRYRPGTPVTHTFTVKNLGPLDAHDVVVADRLPPQVEFVSFEQVDGPPAVYDALPGGPEIQMRVPTLPNGGTATFRMVVKPYPAAEAADVINRIRVYSTAVDFHENNNELYQVTQAGPEADLAIASVRGQGITLTVSNDGPDTVNNVVLYSALHDDGGYGVADQVKYASITPSQGTCSAPELTSIFQSPPLPEFWTVSCTLGALAPGGTATVTVMIDRHPASPAFTHTATVTPGQNDANPANNVSEVQFGAARRRVVRR